MAWEGSTRKQWLPRGWAQLRRHILDRDGGRCTVIKPDGTRCWDKATDVHHLGHSTDHRPSQLTSICRYHHGKATAAEANEARWRVRDRRPQEPHPGLRS